MAKADLTAQRLRELLHYDPETGVLTRAVSTSCRARAGAVAGCINASGYRQIGFNKTLFYAHRLVWLYVHGEWPKGHIDHIDGDKTNNRLNNLRDASGFVNSQNRRCASSNSAHGFLGVTKNKRRWSARIFANGTQIHLGTFDSPEEASATYVAAKRIEHGGCTI